MKINAQIVFLTSLTDEACIHHLDCWDLKQCLIVRDLASLKLANGDILVSFGTSVIVPADILNTYAGGVYNIHAASPDYPGRDPHHWAAYDHVTRYGATAHIMTPKVDDGPIVDVEWFDCESNTRPEELLTRANEAAFKLLSRIGSKLHRGEKLLPMSTMQWGENKRTRTDFLEMCKIPLSISQTEFENKFHSFDGGIHNNLTIELYGRTFRIENPK